MQFFGSSTETVDGKARSILGKLEEDAAPFDILQTVDQKAGEDVDPDDVVSKLRELDNGIDAKLGSIEGHDVDQKEMRDAASAIADRTALHQAGAIQLLSSVVDTVQSHDDPSALSDDFGDALENAGVDQAALTDPDADVDTAGTDADADADTDANTNPDDTTMSEDTQTDDVDQKQDDDDGGSGGGALAMLNDDAREAVEQFADLAGGKPEDYVQEVLGASGGSSNDAPAAGDTDEAAGKDEDEDKDEEYERDRVDQMADDGPSPDADAGTDTGAGTDAPAADATAADQKLDEAALNERVAEAVTSDAVLDEMAGAVAQKMADNDEFADSLVETVDQKGDFVTTDDTVVTAPSNDSETVGDTSPLTGGDN